MTLDQKMLSLDKPRMPNAAGSQTISGTLHHSRICIIPIKIARSAKHTGETALLVQTLIGQHLDSNVRLKSEAAL